MTDVLKNAMNYRNRLKAELSKVEEFLRMAEEFSKDSDELRLTSSKAAAPNGEAAPEGETPKPQTPFERMRASVGGGGAG
jgi:hypothetical protein